MDPTENSTSEDTHRLGSLRMAGRRGKSAQAYSEWTVSVERQASRSEKAGGSSEKQHEQSDQQGASGTVQTWTSRNEGDK